MAGEESYLRPIDRLTVTVAAVGTYSNAYAIETTAEAKPALLLYFNADQDKASRLLAGTNDRAKTKNKVGLVAEASLGG